MVKSYFVGAAQIKVRIWSKHRPSVDNLYIITSTPASSKTNFEYLSSYEWCNYGVIIEGSNSRVLHFSSLSLADVGNYTCKVMASTSALGRSLYGTSPVHDMPR